MLGEALNVAKAISFGFVRSRILVALAPYLLPEQFGDALATAKAVSDETALVAVPDNSTSLGRSARLINSTES